MNVASARGITDLWDKVRLSNSRVNRGIVFQGKHAGTPVYSNQFEPPFGGPSGAKVSVKLDG